MANQYKSALDYAAEELAGDLRRYKITINSEQHAILYNGTATIMAKFDQRKKCLTILRRFIRDAKQAEERERMKDQTSLLDGLE